MSKIVGKKLLAPNIYEIVVEAPRVAKNALPGHFVIVMADAAGERIPLTVADFDRKAGTITLVLMVVGTSSQKLARMDVGDSLHAFLGPLGHASEIVDCDTVVMVAGGVGTAPIYPIARAFHEKGARVISIQGARNKDLLFWADKLAAVSAQHIITTDDGSAGRKALVTEPLKELLAADGGQHIKLVYAIGPAIMMKFCSATTQPFGVKTIVSLNPIMVDGTGMCGGCRVNVGTETKFTCVDGPEFDGHLVDWQTLMARQKVYTHAEKCSLDQYMEKTKKK